MIGTIAVAAVIFMVILVMQIITVAYFELSEVICPIIMLFITITYTTMAIYILSSTGII